VFGRKRFTEFQGLEWERDPIFKSMNKRKFA